MNISNKGSILLAGALVILQGFCGMSFGKLYLRLNNYSELYRNCFNFENLLGLLISSIAKDESEAVQISMGIFNNLIKIFNHL